MNWGSIGACSAALAGGYIYYQHHASSPALDDAAEAGHQGDGDGDDDALGLLVPDEPTVAVSALIVGGASVSEGPCPAGSRRCRP